MESERWQRVKDIFSAALEQSEVHRETYLDKACRGDAELKQQVQSLLANDASLKLEGFLPTDPAEQVAIAGVEHDERDPHMEGRRIGPYEIRRLIARGGMGSVHLAVRTSDYSQRVALKLIKPGTLSDEVLRRFRTETQILAALSHHPHIAALYDAGTTAEGEPYLVMEYVDGERIDTYCDRHKLSTRHRLQLLLGVCSAVQFAHQNTIIHRDLKPGNILVTTSGAPKLIDFGIAKLLNPDLGFAHVMPTRTVYRLLTPEYASPEQAQGQPLSTASDVYSLGVVLYELLTGHRPYVVDSRQLELVARVIAEQHPEKPSSVISRDATRETATGTVKITPASVCRTRDSHLLKLRRELSGDLDTIVMKALRKEPSRRYATVEQLASDLQRYLDGRPVLARPDTLAYRCRKFWQRNRVSVSIAGLLVLTMIGGVAGTIAGWLQARRQWQRAETQAALASSQGELTLQTLNDIVFKIQVDLEDIPAARDVRQDMLEIAIAGLHRVSDNLQQRTDTERSLMVAFEDLGDVFLELGGAGGTDARDAAEVQYRKALDIGLRRWQEAPEEEFRQYDLAICYQRMALAANSNSRVEEALDYFRRAANLGEQLIKTNPQQKGYFDFVWHQYERLGAVEIRRGNIAEALAHTLRAKEVIDEGQRRFDPFLDEYGKQTQQEIETRIVIFRELPEVLDDIEHAMTQPPEIVPRLLYDRASYLVRQRGDHQSAADTLHRLSGLSALPASVHYNAACGYALCREVLLAGRSPAELEAEEIALSEEYATAALKSLEKAEAGGYFNARNLIFVQFDPDLNSLRDREDFRQFMTDLAPPE